MAMEHTVDTAKQQDQPHSPLSLGPELPNAEPPLHPLLQLQRGAGNQALLGLLRSGAIRAKLEIGSIDDPAEREADDIADRVMRMPADGPSISRKCEACEEEEDRQLRMKPSGSPEVAGSEAPSSVHAVLGSAGDPLDAASRAFFEPRFGQDFAPVRIHTDERAAESARQIGAQAYAVGSHIAFAAGRYEPGGSRTDDRRRLLAHELVHVVHQSKTPGQAVFLQRQDTGDSAKSEEGESLPGGAGMERTVPPGTKTTPPPSPSEAARADAIGVGEQWGTALAQHDIMLDILQDRSGGHSVWDTLTPGQKKVQEQRFEDDFASLPALAVVDQSLISAQEDGFKAGFESAYAIAKFNNFLVKLGSQLAILLFSRLAARGVKLPRFIVNLMQRALPAVEPGTGAAFGEAMVDGMRKAGFKGNPFREFMARLNAAPVRLPPQEAAEAIRVATPKWDSQLGTMPTVQQGDILVVPSRAPIPNAPVMGIRPDGTVIMGRAPGLELVKDANGVPVFPPASRIIGDISWE
jgi:hypothetical protein